MNLRFLRRSFPTSLALSCGLSVATALASPIELKQKMLDTAVGDPVLERQVTQVISSFERGRMDHVVRSMTQLFFQIAPDGLLTKEKISLSRRRAVAKVRAQFLGRNLVYDLDGDGAISKAEMEGLYGNDASKIVTLLGTSDLNSDGQISFDELRMAASSHAEQQRGLKQANYLMAFDLDENGIVGIDELLKAFDILAGEDLNSAALQNRVETTTGTFTERKENPETVVENPTNANGLPIELHMVGIYEPRKSRSSEGLARREDVQIKVDRPGVSVTLVLGSYQPARWVINTSEGTLVDGIIASDRNRVQGDVILNGQKVKVIYRDLPLAYKSRGNRFQPFHEAAARAASIRKAASFQGNYVAPEEGFVINEAPGVPTRDEVEAELTSNALPSSELPLALRSAFQGKTIAPGSNWSLRDEGFVGVDKNGKTIVYKLPLEAPEISWPMGVAHDPTGQRIWGVTLGGEGYLYQYDIVKNQWSARSMNNVDSGGLIFDPATGNLIATPAPHGRLGYLTLDASGKVLSKLEIAAADYPGLIGAYDPGNSSRPRLVPVMIDGDLLLVRAEPRFRQVQKGASKWFYLVDLQSGKVRLVR
jgi:EF hand